MEQGLVQVLTAEELTNKVNSESEEKQKVENDAANLVNSLVQHINKKWIDAKDAKLIIEQEMLWSVYQRRGEYTPSKLSQIKAVEQPEIFMNITETKCRNGVAQIKDVIMQPGKRIFSVTPTPVPELPPDVTQKVQEGVLQMYVQMAMMQAQQTGQPISSAQLRELIAAKAEEIKATVHKEIIKVSKKMADDIETQIDDDFLQGGFYDAIDRIIDDIVGLKCGIIKGPIFRREKVKESVTDQETGKIKRQITEKVMPQYERRSPFCIYPSPRSTGVNDGYLFDVIILKPKQIHDLIGVEGYNEEEIRAVLKEFKNGALKNDWLELSPEAKEGFGEEDQRKVSTYYPYENIYCLELWDEVNGQELLDWGMSEEEITDPEDEYSVCIWKIGNHIIKAMLNYDQLGRKPFGVTSFQKQNDTFWGRGIPEMIEDCQQVCNACARAILSNVGIASQPMTDLNIDRIETGSSRKIWPGRVFPTTDEQMGSGSKAVNFYQPPMVTDKLMSVYITFSKIADEHSGVPAFSHGGAAVGGAGSALANYEKILTPFGEKEIGLVSVGDVVANNNGSYSTIEGVFPQGESDIFRMSFSNGEHVDCDMNHRWSVRTHHGRRFRTLTTKQILDKGLFRKTIIGFRNPKGFRPKWMLPLVDSIYFKPREVSIDPYTIGALIGDGDARCRITNMDEEVFERIPYELGKPEHRYHGKARTHSIKGIKSKYHSYGLNCKSLDKFIPDDYLYNSREVRLELLRGLMDTDGCCTEMGETFFTTSSKTLAKDFIRLVRSLGGITNGITIRNKAGYRDFGNGDCFCQEGYCVTFNLRDEALFYIKRKQDRVRPKEKTHVCITGIEYIGKHEATCISVNSKDSLFICANGIPTHNTSSGLHQLREMAAQGIRAVVRNLDNDVIIPCLEFHYDYLLDNKDIFGLIGDYKMVAEGSSALIAKEQMVMRKNEFLQATANPVDMQIIGVENRRKMLFEVAKSLGIEIEDSPFPPPMPPPQQTAPNEKPATLDDSGNPVQGTDNRVANPSRPRQEVSSSGRSGGAGNALPQMKNGGIIDEGGVAEVHDNEVVANVGGRAIVIPNAADSPEWGRKAQVLPDGTFVGGGNKWGQTPPPNTDNRSVGTMAMDVLGAGANKAIDTIGKYIPKPSDLRQLVASKQAPVQPAAKPLSDIQIRFSRLTPEQQAHVNIVQNGVIDSQEALAMIDFFEAENAGR